MGAKKANTDYIINWEILKRSNTEKRKAGMCNLCLEEKLFICIGDHLLNKRGELVSNCRHSNAGKQRSTKPASSRAKKKTSP